MQSNMAIGPNFKSRLVTSEVIGFQNKQPILKEIFGVHIDSNKDECLKTLINHGINEVSAREKFMRFLGIGEGFQTVLSNIGNAIDKKMPNLKGKVVISTQDNMVPGYGSSISIHKKHLKKGDTIINIDLAEGKSKANSVVA